MNSQCTPETNSITWRLLPAPRRGLRLVIAILCIGLAASWISLASPVSEGSEFVTLEKLSDRVILAYWAGLDGRCNLTAIRTEKGLVIIDTEISPRVMSPIKQKLEQAFGRSDWAYVINTHAHDNHPGGNSLFKDAVIVGHQNLAEDMRWIIRRQTESAWRNSELARLQQSIRNLRARLPNAAVRSAAEARLVQGEIKFLELHSLDLQKGYEVVKPSVTFSNQHTLDMGDVRLELVFFGRGHSASDILIYVPQEKLLVTGAIVYQRSHFPEIGEESKLEDVHRFLRVLDSFLAEDVKIDRVVPSHSPPLQKSDLGPVRDYYRRMLKDVRLAQRDGLTLDQAKVRLPASLFPSLRERPRGSWSYGMHERNLRNLWRILKETDAAGTSTLPRQE